MTGRGRGVRAGTLALALVALLGGCTYASSEPGLLGRDPKPTSPAPAPSDPGPPTPRVRSAGNLRLPVAGEATWTSGDGLGITVRFAVLAVRRVEGATVLDWSVTPISGPRLEPDDPVSASLNLALSRVGESNTNVFLLDRTGHHLYRPLTRLDPADPGCLCTPIWRIQQSLRMGRTTLLQTAFPELPAATTAVDVDLVSVPIFAEVAVTAAGRAPVARAPTDLGRPAADPTVGEATPEFAYAPTGQRFVVRVEQLSAADTFTSLTWTVHAVTAGEGLDGAVDPPFADAAPPPHPFNAAVAGGPVLDVAGASRPLRARLVTSHTQASAGQECLCSSLRLWAEVLRRPGSEVRMVTNFAALPLGTKRVDVTFPGAGTVAGVRTERAGSGSAAARRTTAAGRATWLADDGYALVGWPAEVWPTPVPNPAQLRAYRAIVEDLIR